MSDADKANAAIEAESTRPGQLSYPRPDICPSVAPVRKMVLTNFQRAWPATNATLAAAATLLIEDNANPAALILEGSASSMKTTILDFYSGAEPLAYRSDKFTPKSFVSHHAAAKKEKLADVDLLPRIRHKVMVTPELAPLFRGREQDLTENFTILTAVLDGHGLTSDSGTHGRRGYRGDYLFTWLGGTTPLPSKTWKIMAQLGSRLYFWPMPDEDPSDVELDDAIAGDLSYREKLEECQTVVGRFLTDLFGWFGGPRGVEWDRKATSPEIRKTLALMARLLCKLRGVVSVWHDGRDGGLNYLPPNIEQPYRAQAVLFNLARGNALVNGRTHLEFEDLAIPAQLAIGSTPTTRRKVFRSLIENEGRLTARQAADVLRASKPTARKVLEELSLLGIGSLESDPGEQQSGDQPTKRLFLSHKLNWFLSTEFTDLLHTGPDSFPPQRSSETEQGVESDLALSGQSKNRRQIDI